MLALFNVAKSTLINDDYQLFFDVECQLCSNGKVRFLGLQLLANIFLNFVPVEAEDYLQCLPPLSELCSFPAYYLNCIRLQ